MNARQLLIVILLAATSGAALADRGPARGGWHSGARPRVHSSVHLGIFLGAPLAYRYPHYALYPPPYAYYPPPAPYYHYPPVLVAPPVYIEQAQEQQPQQAQASWWYYCAEAKGYYPYVKQCPGGWQRVAPQPPPG